MSSDTSLMKPIMYLAIGGGVMVVSAYKQIKKKTYIKNTAKQIISAASAGNVEIEAIAWPFRASTIAINGEQVVFRHILLQKLVREGKNNRWKTVWSKASSQPFFVFDQSGLMIVNPMSLDKEEVTSIEDLTSTKYAPGKLTAAQIQSFNEFYDNSVSGFSTNAPQGFFGALFSNIGSFRIIERTIAVGSPLLIHGFLAPEDSFRFIHINDDFKLFKERASKLLKSKDFQKRLFDKNHDGVIDAKELYKGFRNTLKSSVKKQIAITDLKPEGLPTEKIYGTITSSTHQDLMLADCFEEQVLRSKPIYLNWLCLYVGAGLIALAIFFFMACIK